MSPLLRLAKSSLGKKYLMALSGIGLFGFVVLHMLGNLQVFLGPDAINKYAHFLKSAPELLWGARLGLLALLGVHFCAGILLAIENMQAREHEYAVKRIVKATLASRTMVVSGLIVLSFVIYHLAHYTLLTIHPEYRHLHDELGRHDVYRMLVLGFSSPFVAGFYVVGVGLLCLHLSHGVGAMFQSLGLKNEAYAERIDTLAKIAAVVLFIGYISIPISVQIGVIK
jgi:succinate dehydrogenase / fumarate reductase cytochrome b subunit